MYYEHYEDTLHRLRLERLKYREQWEKLSIIYPRRNEDLVKCWLGTNRSLTLQEIQAGEQLIEEENVTSRKLQHDNLLEELQQWSS